tara:strand:- start:4 stop:255 length:252 start_codon:yes stop_codon:yes gene_type:complete
MTLCEGRYAKPLSYEKSVSHFGISASEVVYSTQGILFHATMPRFGKSVTRSVLTRQTRARAGQTDESDIPTGEGCSRYPEEEP